jgi:pilus assembly protein CpaE
MNDLSIVVIGPNEDLRRQVCDAASGQRLAIEREFAIYPEIKNQTVGSILGYDTVLVELDSDPEAAIAMIRNATAAEDSITVMVYSAKKDADLLVRCMQAGAREFLNVPVSEDTLRQALQRAAARNPDGRTARPKRRGRTVAFLGAKGGVGSTTLAANYALALREDSQEDVCLVDLNTQLGDTALSLGLEPKFSILDALESAHRLDYDFLSALLVEHSSGLSVLAGPDSFDPTRATGGESLTTLLDLLGQTFAYTVLDAGVGGEFTSAAVQRADLVYVVVQADVPTLRNAQRLIAHFQDSVGSAPRMELVLNRVGAKDQLSESQVEQTLGAKVKWSIPNDFRRLQDALNRGVPLAENDSPVSTALTTMARAFTGKRTEEKAAGSWLSMFKKSPAKG